MFLSLSLSLSLILELESSFLAISISFCRNIHAHFAILSFFSPFFQIPKWCIHCRRLSVVLGFFVSEFEFDFEVAESNLGFGGGDWAPWPGGSGRCWRGRML